MTKKNLEQEEKGLCVTVYVVERERDYYREKEKNDEAEMRREISTN